MPICKRFHARQANSAKITTFKGVAVFDTRVRRCRGKFVAPGKFFSPPYSHNVTNPNPNPKGSSINDVTL